MIDEAWAKRTAGLPFETPEAMLTMPRCREGDGHPGSGGRCPRSLSTG